MAKKKPTSEPLTPEAIRAIRLRLGLTVEQAAEKVGVRPLTWYGWELASQKRRPSRSHVILIRLLENGDL